MDDPDMATMLAGIDDVAVVFRMEGSNGYWYCMWLDAGHTEWRDTTEYPTPTAAVREAWERICVDTARPDTEPTP